MDKRLYWPVRRSELDDQGRPYPLLHMRLAAPNQPLQM